ncbi:RidA family protein [Brevundimonas sp. R86498]|uniref:RidA family protein n=1 Tax=Brevundimonas sp. R86498 TaxID=3093845 RepID=UPI0037C52EB2
MTFTTAFQASLLAGALVVTALPAQAQEIERTYPGPNAFIASTVTVPAGSEIIFLSGQLPSVADPAAPAGTVAAYGDTEAQSESTFNKIRALLETRGLTMADVVSMTVYLVAPPGSERMDFAGMMRAYSRHFGTPDQPNRPSRSTVQVAGLAGPGFLVEIEVTAARTPVPAP